MLAIQRISMVDEVCAVRPVIDTERCKGCGICIAFCPEKILFLGEQLNSYGISHCQDGQ